MSENPEWIEIQVNTFTNWLNHELRHTSITINDLSTELSTGITLIRIVECLQQRICKAKVYVNNPTEIQCLMNIQIALDALNENGIKLVNIGSQDIYEGNLKLILGLIWALIQRYQLGTDAKPLSKKLVLSWLQAVLPEVHLSNFRSNWNNGIALSALINYCDDKLLSDWRDIDPENRLQNCQKALKIAEEHLNVPTIISAEYLSSSDLDELSCMTYLSYFVRKDGPGYNATLRDVQGVLYDLEIPDFGVCFNDGYLLCRMVNVCGGKIDLEEMTFDDKSHWSWNVRQAIMNICAMLIQKQQYEEPSTSAGTSAECYNGQQLKMDLAFAEKASVDIDDLDVVVEDDDGNIVSNDVLNLVKRETDGGASLTLVPEVAGCYQVKF
ncbi:unnamed protein product [Bursaphelenchus okinawaensis]|uniref:Calponin-homology (CH) domain-containing protein n=1 Tax=Bursaphelenchus okinawaensis TaxID=465554 RepID=A0A811LTA7_9BILA|nr:unnamed protein product [Bursaphelenchus okinawaensis]CAG9127662.1 unnamed protein product [Bursaphelenchus okinawaensis]